MMLEVRRDVYLKDYDSGFIDIDHCKIRRFHQHLEKILDYFIASKAMTIRAVPFDMKIQIY